MEMTQPKQLHEKATMRTPPQLMIALSGMILFVLANVFYASRGGDWLPAIVNVAVIIPLVGMVHFVIASAGRKWGWLLLWIPVPVWLIPSLWITAAGSREFRPEQMFEDYVISPIPKAVSQIQARRKKGIGELHCYLYFTCDSNAITAIIDKWQLKMDPQYGYQPPTLKLNTAEVEEMANGFIATKTRHFRLPTNYLKEPILLLNHTPGGGPRIDLWVERDQRRAYFFRD